MEVQFSPRCDFCHNAFQTTSGWEGLQPVSVGCSHTLCRACADNQLPSSPNFLSEMAPHGEGLGEGGSEGRAGLVGCPVCHGGDGIVRVRECVVEALQDEEKREDEDEDEGEGAGEGCEEEEEEEEERACELCADVHGAQYRCGDCKQLMCEMMKQAHSSMRESASHSIVPLSTPPPSSCHAPSCSLHSLPFVLFCVEDQCLVCLRCVTLSHTHHAFKEPHEIEAGWMEGVVVSARVRAWEMESVEEELVACRDQVVSSAAKAEADINALFDELEQRRQHLLNEVAKVRKEVCQQLNDVRTTSRVLRQGIRSVETAMAEMNKQRNSLTQIKALHACAQLANHVRVVSVDLTQQRVTFSFSEGRSLLSAWGSRCGVTVVKDKRPFAMFVPPCPAIVGLHAQPPSPMPQPPPQPLPRPQADVQVAVQHVEHPQARMMERRRLARSRLQ